MITELTTTMTKITEIKSNFVLLYNIVLYTIVRCNVCVCVCVYDR